MARGHVTLGGKDYLITDESYISKIVPMFRPQLQVTGISHEALDQYLYMVWDSWDKGSSLQAKLGRWGQGMYGVADFVDTSKEGRLQLQPSVSLSLASPAAGVSTVGGPRSGTTFVDDAGTGVRVWASPGNAAASDDVYATASSDPAVSTAQDSHYLKATGFGFTIPDEAVSIDGILVEVRLSGSAGFSSVTDAKVRIVKGGTIGSTDRSRPAAAPGSTGTSGRWGTVPAYVSFGGARDRWGETWTPADINGATFGFAISATLTPGFRDPTIYPATANIDHIRITVYYTMAVAADNFNRADSFTLGLSWDQSQAGLGTMFRIAANRLVIQNNATTTTGFMVWTPSNFSGNQSSQLQFISANASYGQGGVGVRMSGTRASATGYILTYNTDASGVGQSIQIRKLVNTDLTAAPGGGYGTLLGAFGVTLNVNDVLKLSVVGSTLSAYINGVLRLQVTDSAITSGRIGIVGIGYGTSGALTDQTWDNWQGSYGTAPPPATSALAHLLGAGSHLYAFFESGEVFRLAAGDTAWTVVAYDAAAHGNVTAVEIGSITVPFTVGREPQADTIRIIAGTDTGEVWYAAGGDAISPSVLVSANGQRINAVGMYRNAVVASRGDLVMVIGVEGGTSTTLPAVPIGAPGGAVIPATMGTGAATFKVRYTAQVPGVAVGFAPFNQVLMAAIQSGHRGSVFAALTADQIIDFYGVLGAFHVQSIATWGSSLVYGGYRAGQEAQVYTYPETLADRLPVVSGIPFDVLAMLPTPEFLLLSFNDASGLWWMDDKGSGPYAQTVSLLGVIPANANQITRSAVMFNGSIYYSVDSSGIFTVTPTLYAVPGASQTGAFALSGSATSGWFDGGFPELQKEGSDIVIRLDSPLLTGQAVELLARRNDETTFTSLGTMAVGENSHTFTYQNLFRRIDLKIVLTGNNPGTGIANNTPVVTSCILRYIPVPVQKRVWSFTVRAQAGIIYLDGTPETRTADQIISDLFAIKGSGVVVFSSALEPTQKNVYVSDVSLKGQLIGKTPTLTVKDEGFVGVELLEV